MADGSEQFHMEKTTWLLPLDDVVEYNNLIICGNFYINVEEIKDSRFS